MNRFVNVDSIIKDKVDGTPARVSPHQARRPSLYNPDRVRLAPARHVPISEWRDSR